MSLLQLNRKFWIKIKRSRTGGPLIVVAMVVVPQTLMHVSSATNNNKLLFVSIGFLVLAGFSVAIETLRSMKRDFERFT